MTLPFERNTNEPSWYHGRPASVPRCTAHISVGNNRDLAADLVGIAVSAAYHVLMAMTPPSLRASTATKSHSFTRSRRQKREACELWRVSCSMATVDSEFIEAPVCCSSLRWARYRLGSMRMPSAAPARRIRSHRRVDLAGEIEGLAGIAGFTSAVAALDRGHAVRAVRQAQHNAVSA